MLALCLACYIVGASAAVAQKIYDIDLHELNLPDALNDLSAQTGAAIVFPYDLVKDRKANPVVGQYTLLQALNELLKNTGLSGGLSAKGVPMISLSGSRTNTTGETQVTQTENDNNGKRNTLRATGVAALFASIATAFSASAEDGTQSISATDTGKLEEVLVSARKREERLQDVPAAVTAASGQLITDFNMVSVTELAAVVPGLTYVTDPGRFGSGPAISLRGISTLTQSSAVQDSVGTVIDGIPMSFAKEASFPDLSDVARVDVLPGPQGTLFGKNATAGIINITTKDPTRSFEASGDVDYSTYTDIVVRAAVSGPLVGEDLLGRISIFDKYRDGYIKNVFDDSKWDNDKQKGVRAKLVDNLTPNDTLKLTGDFLQENNDGGMETVRELLPSTPAYIRTAIGSIVSTENDQIDANSLGNQVQRVGGVSLQWDHTVGPDTLTGLVGYRNWSQDANTGTYSWLTPLNGAPGNGGNTLYYADSHQYSGELRIASPTDQKVDYVAGLFAFNDLFDSGLFDPLPGLLALSPNGTLTGRQQRNWYNRIVTLNYAAFGEANFHLTDHFTLTAGLRATHEKDDATIIGLPTTPGLQRLVVPLGTTEDSKTAGNLSWRTGAQWRFDADRMLYVSGATGWKGPGFNLVSSIAGNAQPVNPETSTSYEAGFKSQWLERRLTANFDVYHAIYKNYQTQGFVYVPGTQVATVLLANAAKLKTQGFESQFAARLTDTTEISLNATYIDATFEDFPGAQCYSGQPVGPGECANGQQNLSGKRLANTPKWAYNVIGKQDFTIPGTPVNGFVTLDYSWRSSVQWDVLGSPYGLENSYGQLGASLVFQKDARYGVKFYGKNLTNTFHTEGIIVGQTIQQFLPVDYKRILGVDVFFRF